jgi:polyribonucleotide 5'-hydroxyl-kinase
MGPRVVVVGPEDSGKSTLCKTLLAYAARMGWCPLFVDCDIGQGEIVVPGCIAASPVDRTCLSVEYGLQKLTPLAVFLGGVSAGTDTKLYSYSAGVVARLVSQYFAHNAHAAASGCIINTMGWVDGVGYELLVSTIRALQADVVLVIGQVCVCIRSPCVLLGDNPPLFRHDGGEVRLFRTCVLCSVTA